MTIPSGLAPSQARPSRGGGPSRRGLGRPRRDGGAARLDHERGLAGHAPGSARGDAPRAGAGLQVVVYRTVPGGVEAESWKRDVDVWFELSMTGIQTSLLDAAEGSVYNPGLRDPTLHDLAAGSGGKGILP